MLKAPRGQAGQFFGVNFTIPILVTDGYVLGPLDLDEQSWEAQASFFNEDSLVALFKHLGIIVESGRSTNIHGEYPVEGTHLVGSETYTTFLDH